MTTSLDETHDRALASWVPSAAVPETDFPIQNLPLGVFTARDGAARPGVAIGDVVLDLAAARALELLPGDVAPLIEACQRQGSLNPLLGAGRASLRLLRRAASRMLRDDTEAGLHARRLEARLLVPMSECELGVPMHVGDYTDFYASIDHAFNVGSMFRPDNPLLPNYKWVPIGYHGRASSIVPSGSPVRRPSGQTRDDDGAPPRFGPSRRLDYELEVGAVVGEGNRLGDDIPLSSAESHLAGLCLVNDWSARDIQTWEYQPLGPFLSKSFATTVSPWIVTLDALAPFRIPARPRADGDPAPLPYLHDPDDQSWGGVDIILELHLSSAAMRAQGLAPMHVSRGRFEGMFWTIAQLVTHHASNGCNLRPGDLLASGTVSGATPESRGCLLERSWRGTQPLQLPSGELRRFLEDGDEIVIRGWCERDGFRRIGFGECRGVVAAVQVARS